MELIWIYEESNQKFRVLNTGSYDKIMDQHVVASPPVRSTAKEKKMLQIEFVWVQQPFLRCDECFSQADYNLMSRKLCCCCCTSNTAENIKLTANHLTENHELCKKVMEEMWSQNRSSRTKTFNWIRICPRHKSGLCQPFSKNLACRDVVWFILSDSKIMSICFVLCYFVSNQLEIFYCNFLCKHFKIVLHRKHGAITLNNWD